MVVEVSTGNGFRSVISYVHKEHEKDLPQDKKPEVIEKNLVFGNVAEMARQMRFVSNGNSRVSKPVMHVSVSFDVKECISEDQRQQAVQSVLKEMGVKAQDHQFLIVKHNDTANPHYHIVLNKVDLDGKKLNLGFDGKREEFIKNRLQVIADKIEQEQGLQRTQGRNIVYDASNEKGYRFLTIDEKAEHRLNNKKKVSSKNPNIKKLQANIQVEINKILQDRNITTPEQFKREVENKGINIRFAVNKDGISGVSFSTDKISVKGSQIGAKWNDIDKALTTNCIYNKVTDLKAHIAYNFHNSIMSSNYVDEAIRAKMPEIKPNLNVWETWRMNPNEEKLFKELHQYAIDIKQQYKEQKTTFELAKEKREGIHDQDKNQQQGYHRGFTR